MVWTTHLWSYWEPLLIGFTTVLDAWMWLTLKQPNHLAQWVVRGPTAGWSSGCVFCRRPDLPDTCTEYLLQNGAGQKEGAVSLTTREQCQNPLVHHGILGVFILKREHSTHCWDSYCSHVVLVCLGTGYQMFRINAGKFLGLAIFRHSCPKWRDNVQRRLPGPSNVWALIACKPPTCQVGTWKCRRSEWTYAQPPQQCLSVAVSAGAPCAKLGPW